MSSDEKWTIKSMAEIARERSAMPPATSWGPWRWDGSTATLDYYERPDDKAESYWIPVKDCRTSAAVLDWIAQIASKTWGTAEVVGNLVLAFDSLLGLQDHYCGSGMSGEPGGTVADPVALARKRSA